MDSPWTMRSCQHLRQGVYALTNNRSAWFSVKDLEMWTRLKDAKRFGIWKSIHDQYPHRLRVNGIEAWRDEIVKLNERYLTSLILNRNKREDVDLYPYKEFAIMRGNLVAFPDCNLVAFPDWVCHKTKDRLEGCLQQWPGRSVMHEIGFVIPVSETELANAMAYPDAAFKHVDMVMTFAKNLVDPEDDVVALLVTKTGHAIFRTEVNAKSQKFWAGQIDEMLNKHYVTDARCHLIDLKVPK